MIRNATADDFFRIREIYAYARQKMRENGNPNQWGDSKPAEELLLADIREGNLYVLEEEGRVMGVFAFLHGADPTYTYIEDGQWLSADPYCTIHRIAGALGSKGVLQKAVAFGKENLKGATGLRIDTHKDNKIMQGAITKAGFTYCGIIYLADGNPRLAYEQRF